MADNHNEFVLSKNILIGLIVLNLTVIVFTFFTGGQGLAIGSGKGNLTGTQSQLNTLQQGINGTSRNLAFSFSNNPLGNYTNVTQSCNLGICPFNGGLLSITNVLKGIGNAFINFLGVILNILILIGYSVVTVLYLLVVLIPSLFTAGTLGVFGPIFFVVYGLTATILTLYGLYLITKIWERVKVGI